MIFATTDNHIGFLIIYINYIQFYWQYLKGYGAACFFPVKQKIESLFIKDGSDSSNDWIGEVKSNEKAFLIDPEKGYIITANNKFASDNLIHHPSIHMISTGRGLRINILVEELIKKKSK